jgi:hypothetical protein
MSSLLRVLQQAEQHQDAMPFHYRSGSIGMIASRRTRPALRLPARPHLWT